MKLFCLILAFTPLALAEAKAHALVEAKVILDTSLRGVNILERNVNEKPEIDSRGLPMSRGDLGQALCASQNNPQRPRRGDRWIKRLYLIQAKCQNDIDYVATCKVVIPTHDGSTPTLEDKCWGDEICVERTYKNYLGHSTTEVSCVVTDPDHERSWSTSTSDTLSPECGPRLKITGGGQLTLNLKFFGGDKPSTQRNWVSSVWIQSNKRPEWITVETGVNGMWWEGQALNGETIQACFRRDTENVANKAVMDWFLL